MRIDLGQDGYGWTATEHILLVVLANDCD